MSVLGHIIILLTCLTLREFSKHYQVLHSVRYINFISRILHDSLTTRLFSCSLAPLETAAISIIAPRRHCAALTVCVVDIISANAFLCRLDFALAESRHGFESSRVESRSDSHSTFSSRVFKIFDLYSTHESTPILLHGHTKNAPTLHLSNASMLRNAPNATEVSLIYEFMTSTQKSHGTQ